MTKHAIMADLNGLIAARMKTASEISGLTKHAAPADPLDADNGTEAPKTGEQYKDNIAAAGEHQAPAKVDGGAVTNPVGGSIENSTEGATAVAVDGQSGAKGADLEVKKDADNGKVSQSELSKTASELIARARGVAGALKVAAEKLPVDARAEAAQVKLAQALGKSEGQVAAAKPLTAAERFFAKAAMEAGGVAPEAAGAAIDSGAPEAKGAANDGVQELIKGLEDGSIGQAQAEQILQELVKSGAISEEDIAEIQALEKQLSAQGAQGAPGEAAPGGEAGAGAPPAPPVGPEGAEPAPEDLQAMKVAALDCGPGHPDYPAKLRALYKSAHDFGYQLALKTAQEISEEDVEHGAAEGDTGDHEAAETPAQEKAEHGPGGEEAGETPAQEHAEHAGNGSEAAPGAPSAEGIEGATQDPLAGLQINSPEEAKALQEVLAEMGLDPAALEHLKSQPMPAPQGKLASVKAQIRNAILLKSAAVMSAPTSTHKKA